MAERHSVREQLLGLYELQKLDLEIRGFDKLKDSIVAFSGMT